MRSLGLVLLLQIAMTATAQHSMGFGGRAGGGRFGPPAIVSRPAQVNPRISGSGFRRGGGFHQRFNNFSNGYLPYLGAYPFDGDYGFDYAPPAEYPAITNTMIAPPSFPPAYPEPPKPAHSVINEYKWNEPATALDDQATTFTIALNDGSKCYPVAVWTQGGNLNYIDSGGRHQVLSTNQIDRDMTQRLNREKNLRLQLPPAS